MWLTRRLVTAKPPIVPSKYPRMLSIVAPDCYNCGELVAAWSERSSMIFPCGDCGAIQLIPKDVSYFDLFSLTPAILLDAEKLKKRFRDMQTLLHPDKFARSSVAEKEVSAENSALVNVAYQTLRRPLTRVRYVLLSKGINALSEKSGTAGMDPMLLMEIMELREQVEGLKSKEELEEMHAQTQETLNAIMEALAQSLTDKDTQRLTDQAIRLQYFSKVDEEIEAMIEKVPFTY